MTSRRVSWNENANTIHTFGEETGTWDDDSESSDDEVEVLPNSMPSAPEITAQYSAGKRAAKHTPAIRKAGHQKKSRAVTRIPKKKSEQGWGMPASKRKHENIVKKLFGDTCFELEEEPEAYIDDDSRAVALFRNAAKEAKESALGARPQFQMAKQIVQYHTSEYTEIVRCMATTWSCAPEKVWKRFGLQHLVSMPYIPEQVFLARVLNLLDSDNTDKARDLVLFLCKLYNLRMVYRESDTAKITEDALREVTAGVDLNSLLSKYQSRVHRVRDKFETGLMSRESGAKGSVTAYCRFWNKGQKCRFGNKCKAIHACFLCHKTGHGVVKCYQIKRRNDRPNRNNDDRRDGNRNNADQREARGGN